MTLPFTRENIRVLAVDDDPVQLGLISSALTQLGYKVSTATNGQEALNAMASKSEFDLVLTDVMMPILDGPQFLIQARSNPKYANIPIVMMSSNDQYEIVFDCLSKGADDYIVKPLTPQILKNIYANVWMKRKRNEAAFRVQQQIVDATEATKKMEQMKKNFELSIQTPLNPIIQSLDSIIKSGAVLHPHEEEFVEIVQQLKSMRARKLAEPSTQATTSFIQSQFGSRKSPALISPVAQIIQPKRQMLPAPGTPRLDSLNLGDTLTSKDFNVWSINEGLLMNLAHDLFALNDVATILAAKPNEAERFIKKVAACFKLNPFHNFRRAVDCLQLMSIVLNRLSKFTPNEVTAMIFASLVHDIDHPGTNNAFQMQTGSQLAMLYNDRSILEGHSASVGSKMVQESFSEAVKDPQFPRMRHFMIECILGTDYTKLGKFLGKAASISLDWGSEADRLIAMKLLTLMSDMSFAVRPWNVAGYWYGMMRDEQFQQGDMERRLGLKISPFMDRQSERSIAILIKAHYRVMVLPIFQAVVKMFPDLEEFFMNRMRENLSIIEEMEKAEQSDSAPTK